MPLKLVTGPANSGRAGEVLGAYRARLPEEPILVVPGFRDVEHSLRELAEHGAVFGASVMRFGRLFDEIGRRCAAPQSPRASELQRRVLVEEAIRSIELRALKRSSGSPGFARAAAALVAELERSLVEPHELEAAPRAHIREAGAIYRAYRARLETAGLVDEELAAWRAVDALRERPHQFGSTPVFVYGFDDFTAVERDALESLALHAGVDVTVSLPYEPGRAAFKAIAPVYQRLAEVAAERIELPAVSDHYADESRAALHGVERGLYEGAPEPLNPAGAVRLLSAGGERAEVELVAAEALRLLRSGTPAGDVAVVFRDPARYATLAEQVFGAYGVPYSIERYVPLAHTSLGRGLLALLRCATPDGGADDLLAYMRTPGFLDKPTVADRVEADIRKAGARTVAQARRAQHRVQLPALDRLAAAAPGEELLAGLERELDWLFGRTYRREAPLFDNTELDDPRVWTQAHAAIAELQALAAADPALLLDARRVHDELSALRVRLGDDPRPDRVQVAAPEAIRARRFEVVFVCGLQEGEFPRARAAEPFLSDDDRRALAAAGGPALPAREDELERERHLFYVCCSRAERRLFLSSRFADEEGNPQVGSFLLEEVRDLFDGLDTERRSLSDVTWPASEAPTAVELERALALAGPRREAVQPDGLHEPEVLARLDGERGYSASDLETFADCPVKWLVDRVLRPDELEPDPEPLVRGSYAHAVLEATYRRLREETGARRVTQASLPDAERILLQELDSKREQFRISPKEARASSAVRKLEFDLLKHLRREAGAGGEFEPAELEYAFGDDEHDPLRLEPEGIAIRGRIDRVDVSGGRALVVDYKTGRRAYPVARWDVDHRLQVALYMLAVRELLGVEPIGGVYVPLADPKEGPRGLVREDAVDELGTSFKKPDVKPPDDFEDQLRAARERVCEVAERMRSGEMRPCPDSCAWNGGCSYPSICRVEKR